jgi:hypothetical protein
MSNELEYSSTLTGASFLYYELKQVVGLKVQGVNDSEVKVRAFNENLFQYKVKRSLKRTLPSVLRRAGILDETLCQMMLEQPLETGKIINLYAIMKTDRLFFEFMNEVIREKLESHNYLFEKKDLNGYMASKAEQDARIAGWSEQNVSRLMQGYIKVLLEVGLLKDKKTGELSKLLIDEELKRHLIQIGDIAYVRVMGE